VIATMGDTQVFAAVVTSPGRDDLDFFPLTVDYREKTEAAGKIPGGFFKREGRPTTKEILTMRMIDRSIRPLFPAGFRREVQVMSRVFGYDGENPADILSMIASFAALHVSNIPFHGALGAMRIGKVGGGFQRPAECGHRRLRDFCGNVRSIAQHLSRSARALLIAGTRTPTPSPPRELRPKAIATLRMLR